MTPDFYIIGGPKCGTTSLARWLGSHPQVAMSNPKEPHGFADDVAGEIELADYNNLFKGANPSLIKGEASTWYLWSKSAVPNILRHKMDAKFIVCIRNPAEMTWSMHGHHLFKGEENISDFEEAWGLQEKRKSGKNLPFRMRNPVRVQYAEACSLGSQLERLYSIVSKENVLVIFLDDMAKDPRSSYNETLTFLGIKSHSVDFKIENSARERRFALVHQIISYAGKLKSALGIPAFNTGLGKAIEKKNEKRSTRGPMPNHVRKMLEDFFSEETSKLETATGRDLSHWKRSIDRKDT